mgnify:CR=1 FL=1
MVVVDGDDELIESNPRFGPLAFKALQDFASGTAVSTKIVISDDQYDESNAASKVGNAF